MKTFLTRGTIAPTQTMRRPSRPSLAQTTLSESPYHANNPAASNAIGAKRSSYNFAAVPVMAAPKAVAAPVRSDALLRPSGQSRTLPPEVRSKMERSFGVDFSKVRIFEGTGAQSIGALAATRGTHIHFTPGLYAPHTELGQQLLAHELAHVVQQDSGRVNVTRRRAGVGINDDRALEREADEMGMRATRVDRVRPPGRNAAENAAAFRVGIRDFQDAHPTDSIRAGQGRVLGSARSSIAANDSSDVIQCYGSVAYEPNAWNAKTGQGKLGKKTTDLAGEFGNFHVDHGLTVDPVAAGGNGRYEIKIEMSPNEKTKAASNIRFVQTIRRGTTGGTWSTKAADLGMTADRARRAAAGGWRVDRADPTTSKTPFYGHHMAAGALGPDPALANSAPGQYKGAKPWMYDGPSVIDPGVAEFAANAKDDKTGASFGSVAWGFKYSSADKVYQEETPRLLPGSTNWFLNLFSEDRRRVGGERAAAEKWNEVYGKGGTGKEAGDADVRKVPGV